MPIIAQYLFGSHARRDFTEESDIDLLSIVNEREFKSYSNGKLSVSYYPEHKFIDAASRGDLFVLHIFLEAVLIYDSMGLHSRMQSSFRQKSDYSKEIQDASDLAYFICTYGPSVRNKALLNKRIAWCARTILIARSVENNQPIFNADRLVDFSGKPFVRELLQAKSYAFFDDHLINELKRFMILFGAEQPASLLNAKKRDFWYYFRSRNNAVALKLMDETIQSVAKDIYAF